MAQHGGSATAFLRTRREHLTEIQGHNTHQLCGPGSQSPGSEGAPDLQELARAQDPELQRHGHEGEELACALRDADLHAADLSEDIMEDVVNAVDCGGDWGFHGPSPALGRALSV